MDQDLVGTGMK